MAKKYLLQKEILPQAAALVKEGGILLYSTCTIDKKENTEMIEWFLKNHPEFRLCDSFGERWADVLQNEKAMVQLLPFEHETDGFFIAKMERISS